MLTIFDQKALVEQCRKQDRQAQKILFDAHAKKMMTICLRYLKNEEDAVEVLNNAFLNVFTKIHQYQSSGSLEAWIKRIVINASIDFVRSNKSYRAYFISTNEFNPYGEPVDEVEAPDDWLETVLDFSKEEIFEMVAELPKATRIVFNLFAIDELTHRQISEILKISDGTSKWHVSNARKMLKEKINQAVRGKLKISNS